MARPDLVICACCLGPIGEYASPERPGERVVEIRIGKLLESQSGKPGRPRSSSDRFKEDSIWGLMHADCFVKSVDSPDDVFAGLVK